ncbi:16S rRNA (adenine(1518)-N(6)/adenine(1519)-N(6))-dimethyltransferase RsmA [Patescibacteria group bacterium]|nr:16S rRNA (adenine(1518)-N(6)/adenine(1519)-N(6))-dimethyltransferase RsmA [Patescibacteria group bacterium]
MMLQKNKTYKAKKSLGQNFLKSSLALSKIIEAGEVVSEDTVLEIGPGKGALTEKLLEKSNAVIAVEKDSELFVMLSEKFSKEIVTGKLILLEEDILDFNISKYTKKYKIVANIPYNITGAILKKFLTEKLQPELVVLMVQNEVGKRIVASDGKESILSISVKAYGVPKMVMKVAARYFSPAPKVDSAIISIKNISRRIFEENNVSEDKFWEIVKKGFAHKRKKLSGNLKNVIKNETLSAFKEKRAENLSLEDWIEVSK